MPLTALTATGRAVPTIDVDRIIDPDRHAVFWLLVAFVLTTAVTRWVTRRIRGQALARIERALDKRPHSRLFRNVVIAGIHIHHQVWGILLVLLVGVLTITYHPSGFWSFVLAAGFGIGAALALDEFAMWLHLEDVYWSTEGRSSISALMVAASITIALVLGANPLDVFTTARGQEIPGIIMAAVAVMNLIFVVVCILKGKLSLGLVGLFVPLVAFFGAVLVAKPDSWWARVRYEPGSRNDRVSRERFGERYHLWLNRVRDFIGGAPNPPTARHRRVRRPPTKRRWPPPPRH